MAEPHSSNFRVITTNVLGVRIFRKFIVISGSLIKVYNDCDSVFIFWTYYCVVKPYCPLYDNYSKFQGVQFFFFLFMIVLSCYSDLGAFLGTNCHAIMVLFVLRKLILQMRLRSRPMGLDVWFWVWLFIYFHTLCVRTVKALVRLRGCAGSPEPLLVAYVISTIISWAVSIILECLENLWGFCIHH